MVGEARGSMRQAVLIASIPAMLALAACATARPGAGDLPVSEYAGHFTGVANWFRPCGAAAGDTLWWATFMGAAVGQWEQLQQAGRVRLDAPSYLRVRAGRSDRRAAGADGRGSRYLYVHDVLEVRPPQPGDC